MTFDQLLELDGVELEKLTDAELHAIYDPYLKFTRPEKVDKTKYNKNPIVSSPNKTKTLQKQANEMLAKLYAKFGDKLG